MSLSATTLEWAGLTLYGTRGSGQYTFRTLEGWEGLPESRRNQVPRARAHGSFSGRVWSDERVVRVSGQCISGADRDAVFVALTSTFGFDDTTPAPLTIAHAGRSLTAYAQLTRFNPTAGSWGSGVFGWAAEWVCHDPLRYGTVQSQYTSFPLRTGGLRWPMFSDGAGVNVGATDWGDVGASGRAGVSNPGTASSWPQFQVEGPVPVEGFEIVTVGSGARLRYTGAIPAGSTLVIDTATGLVLMDGKYDRVLAVSEPEPVQPGATAEYQFINLGARTDAVLTASLTPAYW